VQEEEEEDEKRDKGCLEKAKASCSGHKPASLLRHSKVD
jgi:hypothetical protein